MIFKKGHGFEFVIKKFYNEVNKDCDPKKKNVEIIFVSCDNSEEEFREHVTDFPYPMIPFDDPRILDLIEDKEAIPIVPLLRKDGSVAKDSVKKLITEKGAKCLEDLIELSK